MNGGQIAKLHSLSVCLGAVVQVTVRASKMRRREGESFGNKVSLASHCERSVVVLLFALKYSAGRSSSVGSRDGDRGTRNRHATTDDSRVSLN